MTIWVDADACPKVIKEILYRAAERTAVPVILVANRLLYTPPSRYISAMQVADGFDVADSEIVRRLQPGDLVITANIPLAAEVIAKGGYALDPRGELYSTGTIHARLTMRDFMETLRASGIETDGRPLCLEPTGSAIICQTPQRVFIQSLQGEKRKGLKIRATLSQPSQLKDIAFCVVLIDNTARPMNLRDPPIHPIYGSFPPGEKGAARRHSARETRKLPSLYLLLLLIVACPALAHSEEFHDVDRFGGALEQWKVFRTSMNDYGIILKTVNTVDVLSNVSGGVRQGTALVGGLDLLLTIDINKSIPDWQGTLFVYGLGTYGDDLSSYVGDIQGVSSIAAPNTFKLFEAWYQQNLSDRFSFLAGLYDVTSEFDVLVSSSALFLNGSFGTGAEFAASGRIGPSTFPATSLGIRGQAILDEAFMMRAVIAD